MLISSHGRHSTEIQWISQEYYFCRCYHMCLVSSIFLKNNCKHWYEWQQLFKYQTAFHSTTLHQTLKNFNNSWKLLVESSWEMIFVASTNIYWNNKSLLFYIDSFWPIISFILMEYILPFQCFFVIVKFLSILINV